LIRLFFPSMWGINGKLPAQPVLSDSTSAAHTQAALFRPARVVSDVGTAGSREHPIVTLHHRGFLGIAALISMAIPTLCSVIDEIVALPPVDTAKAHPARLYDYYLGGKDNYAADRAAARKVMAAFPQARKLAVANRGFLVRAVRFLAGQGIRQYLDLGTGIPTSPNVHEVARQVIPDAHVAYVDNDPVVTRHSQALRATNEGVVAVFGDIRRPDEILADPAVNSVIDFADPVAILTVAVLHFVPDADEPAAIVKAFADRIAPGSYLALSHISGDNADPRVVDEITTAYQGATAPAVLRSAEEIGTLFGGLGLVEPRRLVDVSQWHPDQRAVPTSIRILAGLAQKS
jgi:S-adenosyl methyltransferase